MDLRELVNAFWKYRILFLGTAALFIAAGLLVWALQPVRFAAEITMNVARNGVRATEEYAYDDFYRLQADERFADTVVRWLESPRIVGEIAKEASVPAKEISFDADRLSSQVIRVRFMVRETAEAKEVAEALFDALNRETASLNRDRSEDGWFVLVGEAPSVVDARLGKGKIFSMAMFLGVFFGFLAVMFRWYWLKGEIHENRD